MLDSDKIPSKPKTSRFAVIRDLTCEYEDGHWDVKWSTYQGIAIILGVVMLFIYSYFGPGRQALPICLLVAGASLAMGILIGFLFGIPRAAQTEPLKPTADTKAADTKAALDANAGAANANVGAANGGKSRATGGNRANTNLEQISDWLTKIIVGVGLVQLSTIPGKLRSLADYLAGAFGNQVVPSALVMTIICYFGIFGFLLGYLWARIYLMKELPD